MIDEIKEYMKTGKIFFTYKKKNGEIRTATGTLCRSYIENEGGSYEGYKDSKLTFTYWDVDVNWWRCCIINNIISYSKPDAYQLSFDF